MQHEKKRPVNKHLPQGLGVKNYVPYQQGTQTTTANQGQQGQTAGTNTNQYTLGQSNLQGNLGGLYSQMLNGNIPQSFTDPQAAINAYNTNFQQGVAPGMAAQYGAGSPAIASANALGLAQLQGGLYNTGVQNYQNALNSGTNYALGMPTGTASNGMSQAQGTSSSTTNNTTGINALAFLSNLLGSIP